MIVNRNHGQVNEGRFIKNVSGRRRCEKSPFYSFKSIIRSASLNVFPMVISSSIPRWRTASGVLRPFLWSPCIIFGIELVKGAVNFWTFMLSPLIPEYRSQINSTGTSLFAWFVGA